MDALGWVVKVDQAKTLFFLTTGTRNGKKFSGFLRASTLVAAVSVVEVARAPEFLDLEWCRIWTSVRARDGAKSTHR